MIPIAAEFHLYSSFRSRTTLFTKTQVLELVLDRGAYGLYYTLKAESWICAVLFGFAMCFV
jgi:hypothetical protein